MITPFKEDNSIDFESLGKIVVRLIEGNTDYIVVLGTTGESALMKPEEREAVIEFVKEKNAGRVPLVLGYGGYNTEDLIENLPKLNLDGISAILSVTPYYVKPNQEGLYQHYKTLAHHSPVPVVLYNVPGRTGCNMTAATTLRLAQDCPNIIAVKEASGKLDQIEEIIREKPENFQVLSGDDGIAYPLMTLGASGVISVIGNAYPRELSLMIHDCLKGNIAEAKRLHYKYSGMIRLLFEDGNPAGIVNLMSQLGLCEDRLRLPLVKVRKETAEKIRLEIENIR